MPVEMRPREVADRILAISAMRDCKIVIELPDGTWSSITGVNYDFDPDADDHFVPRVVLIVWREGRETETPT